MNSFGPLEQIGDETTTTGMKHRIREAKEEKDEVAALRDAQVQQRTRALPPPQKYSDRESEELERDGFQVVKSRSSKRVTPAPPAVAASNTLAEETPGDAEEGDEGRGRMFWIITVAAVSCVALICGKALLS